METIKDIVREMREVLEWCRDFMRDIYDGKEGVKFSAYDIERIDAALKTPLRNCEVGTAEEQHKRFMHFCTHVNKSVCMNCPLIGNTSLCQLQWAQLPYEEGGAE